MRPPTEAEKSAYPDRIWFTGMENQPKGNATGRYGLTNDHGATAAYWRFQPGLVEQIPNGAVPAVPGVATTTSLAKRLPDWMQLFFELGCQVYGAQVDRLASNLCYGNWGPSAMKSIKIPFMNHNDWINFYEDKSCRQYYGQIFDFSGCLNIPYMSFYGCTRCR